MFQLNLLYQPEYSGATIYLPRHHWIILHFPLYPYPCSFIHIMFHLNPLHQPELSGAKFLYLITTGLFFIPHYTPILVIFFLLYYIWIFCINLNIISLFPYLPLNYLPSSSEIFLVYIITSISATDLLSLLIWRKTFSSLSPKFLIQ